jgi:hypothetical protein
MAEDILALPRVLQTAEGSPGFSPYPSNDLIIFMILKPPYKGNNVERSWFGLEHMQFWQY